jgi:hypothetical protein
LFVLALPRADVTQISWGDPELVGEVQFGQGREVKPCVGSSRDDLPAM